MIAQKMIKPSFWIDTGIKLSKVKNLYLFKFTEELQQRLDELFDKKKTDLLTADEDAEFTGLLELNQIFTLLNAKIIAESK